MRMRQPRELVLKKEVSRLAENRVPDGKPDKICGRVGSIREGRGRQGLEDKCHGERRREEEKKGREGRDGGAVRESRGTGTEEDRRK